MTKSLNFWTSVFTILISAIFTTQGVEVDFTAAELAEIVLSRDGIGLVITLFMLLYTPLFKTYVRIREAGYDWAALKSRNFAAHIVSLIAILLGLWLGAEQVGFALALLTQVINFIAHRYNFGA
jgi:hypothetical protein